MHKLKAQDISQFTGKSSLSIEEREDTNELEAQPAKQLIVIPAKTRFILLPKSGTALDSLTQAFHQSLIVIRYLPANFEVEPEIPEGDGSDCNHICPILIYAKQIIKQGDNQNIQKKPERQIKLKQRNLMHR